MPSLHGSRNDCSLFRSDYFPVTFAFWLHILRLHIRDVPSLLLPPGLGEYWSGIVLNDVGNDTCWGTCEVYHLFYHTLVIAFACNSRLMSFLNPLSLPTFSLWSVSIQSLGDGCMAYASLHGVASCHACHRASRRGRNRALPLLSRDAILQPNPTPIALSGIISTFDSLLPHLIRGHNKLGQARLHGTGPPPLRTPRAHVLIKVSMVYALVLLYLQTRSSRARSYGYATHVTRRDARLERRLFNA